MVSLSGSLEKDQDFCYSIYVSTFNQTKNRESRHFSVISILMKFLSTVLFLTCFLSSCGQKVKETFFVPGGFEGRINVIFNQPNAAAIPIENGRRIYNIPADGILVTSSKFEAGWIDQEYYYIGKDGKKTQIPVLDFNTKDVPDKPSVINYGVTGVYGSSTDTHPLKYAECIIASKATNDSIYSPAARAAFDELIIKKSGRTY